MVNRNLILLFFIFIFLQQQASSQDLTPQKIFENNSKSVVLIKCLDQSNRKKSQGSGIILSDRKIIITNFHIFAGSDNMEITHNDTVIKYSEIAGINIEKDIMIIKLADDNLPQINIGNSSELKIGDRIYAIGSPYGMENTISEGIVSGFRTIGESKKNRIQITASLSSGSSGGAVFNSKGELVGISDSKMLGGENINFMIPINEALAIADSGLYDKRSLKALKLFYKGTEAEESGDYIEAIKQYSQYLEIVPNECKAYNYRGKAYLGLKQFEKAMKDFKKAIEIEKDNKPAIYNRGECNFLLKEYEIAIKDFSKVLRLDSTFYSAYFARALTYSKLEEFKKAIKDYNIYLHHNPDDITALTNRGLVFYELEEYEKAINDWKKVIYLDPSSERSMKKLIEIATYYWFRK